MNSTWSTSDAVHAVSRLLSAGTDLDGAPQAVARALVVEARRFSGAEEALLVALDADAGEVRTVAGATSAAPAVVPLATPAVEPLAALLQTNTDRMQLDGATAIVLCEALGLGPLDSVLVIPMRARHDRHALVLAGRSGHAISHDGVELVAALAQAATVSLAQLRLAAEQARQAARQSALLRATKSLNASLELEQVLERIGSEAAAILHADNAVVYLGSPSEGVTVATQYGHGPELVGYHLPPGRGLAGQAIMRDEAIAASDYHAVANLPASAPFHGIRSSIAVPMHWDGAARGVLAVGYTRRLTITQDHVRMLTAFAELAAVACANASAHQGLAEAARTDSLTGCLNHAALHEAIQREIRRCERTGGTFSIALIDLDRFKSVNEEHGHLVGDEVLRRVGHGLRSAVRPYDLVARYGGDEFVIVVVGTGERVADEVATRAIERIHDALRDLGRAATAATAGIAEWHHGMSANQLLERADRALLLGKRTALGHVTPASEVPSGFLPVHSYELVEPDETPAAEHLRLPEAGRDDTERLRTRTRQLAMASALGTRIAAMTEVDAIVNAAVEELHRAFGFFLVAVLRIRGDGYVASIAGRGRAFVRLGERGWCQPRDAGVIGRCLRERRTQLINDVAADADYDVTPETRDVRSELCVPLWVGDELWGAINLEEVRTDAFDADDARLVEMVADQVGSALRSALLYERLERAYLGTAEALASALEARDSYTAAHAHSIVAWAEEVGRRLGMDEDGLRDLRYGAAFHDIGKLAVPDAILNKRGPLTDPERDEVERHTVIGEQILAPVEFLSGVRPLVRHEHERWDGSGYPDGLTGEQIPLGARIILACDAYHAMTSDRPYRPAMSHEHARAELRAHAGSQFDPLVVDALLAVLAGEGDGPPPPEPAQPLRVRPRAVPNTRSQ